MLLVFRSFGDPLLQDVSLFFRQLFVGRRRWHENVFVVRKKPGNHLAVIGLAWQESSRIDGCFAIVESQVGFARGFGWTVTEKAIVRKNWSDIAIEINFVVLGGRWICQTS